MSAQRVTRSSGRIEIEFICNYCGEVVEPEEARPIMIALTPEARPVRMEDEVHLHSQCRAEQGRQNERRIGPTIYLHPGGGLSIGKGD